MGLATAASLLFWSTVASAPRVEGIKITEIELPDSEAYIYAGPAVVVAVTTPPQKKTEKEIIAELQKTDPLVYCLMEHESTFNGNAIGAAGEIGWLQFLPTTYAGNCVKLYGFDETRKDLQNQIGCAQAMIADNQVTQWTTWIYCQKYL